MGRSKKRRNGLNTKATKRREHGNEGERPKGGDDGAGAKSVRTEKKSAEINLVQDTKETFEELQLRKAHNLARCRLSLCLATLFGLTIVIVGTGLLIAFGYVGRCSDSLYPFACSAFECCSIACTDSDSGAVLTTTDSFTQECVLIIATPLETAGVVLVVVGCMAIVTVAVCFIQVNRTTPMSLPAPLFGHLLTVSIVLVGLAVFSFVVAALARASVISSVADETSGTTLEEGFWIFAFTSIWPGIVLLAGSLLGLYIAWKRKAVARTKTVVVVGLCGSGKSHVVTGLISAAEAQGGCGRSGVVQNMGGKSTSGVFMQAVTRPDGLAVQMVEVGGRDVRVATMNAIVFVVDTCDPSRMQEAGVYLEQLFSRPEFWGLPLLVVANQSGRWNAMTTTSVADALNLHVIRDRHWYIIPCSATRDSSQHFSDALEWLCEELKIPSKLEHHHPNFLAPAFPCMKSEDTNSPTMPTIVKPSQESKTEGKVSTPSTAKEAPPVTGTEHKHSDLV